MIFIVEGPDGAGKSTLIEKIKRGNPSAMYRHFGAPKTPEDAQNYYQVYAQAINDVKPGETHIFDRSWYSDMVYGPVLRDTQEMTQEHADMLSAMVVASGGGLLIYCTAPIKTLWSRCIRRGETLIKNQATLQMISVGYSEVMQNKVKYLPIIRYDTAARW